MHLNTGVRKKERWDRETRWKLAVVCILHASSEESGPHTTQRSNVCRAQRSQSNIKKPLHNSREEGTNAFSVFYFRLRVCVHVTKACGWDFCVCAKATMCSLSTICVASCTASNNERIRWNFHFSKIWEFKVCLFAQLSRSCYHSDLHLRSLSRQIYIMRSHKHMHTQTRHHLYSCGDNRMTNTC